MDQETPDPGALWRGPRQTGVFAGVDRQSRGRVEAHNFAVLGGAENLLVKALARWRDDRARALSYVDAALRLRFDGGDGAENPAASAAVFLLYDLLTEEVESAFEEDALWLDAALRVLDQAEPDARSHLRDGLVAVDQDYELATTERRRLRAAVKPIPQRARPGPTGSLDPGYLKAEIINIVEICVAYQEALQELDAPEA